MTIVDSSAVKQLLFTTGHFNNPNMPTGITSVEQLADLSLTSDAVRTAIASYQDFMAEDFQRLSKSIHNREGVADGLIGPATEKLFQVDRCKCPDYELAIDGSVAEAGSGSWPSGCHSKYPNNHAFAIWFDKSRMPSWWKPVFDECFTRVKAAYRNIGIVFFETKDKDRANTVVTWERGRGWIGLAIVPSNPRCGQRIWAKFDTRYRPSSLVDRLSTLLAHEWGHNMGLRHTRGGVMNPSISSKPFGNEQWQGDPSFRTLKRWFGGEPVPGGDDTPPSPPTPPDNPPGNGAGVVITGTVEVHQDGKSLGEFILMPKPRV